ncbi:MAG TPA: nuclear transport factor 2 family protein [Stellaceae bacterium]|nr:nuclear transport factor 2 family protein [Stellaceae bacterium]
MTSNTGMSDHDAALSENLEFYRAFSMRDMAAMERIWSATAPVSCIHPGWPALYGREAVLTSWRNILRGSASPQVLCYEERVTLHGDLALVTCDEEVPGGTVIATNVFVRERGLWRMVHHQGSPLMMPKRPEGGATRH